LRRTHEVDRAGVGTTFDDDDAGRDDGTRR